MSCGSPLKLPPLEISLSTMSPSKGSPAREMSLSTTPPLTTSPLKMTPLSPNQFTTPHRSPKTNLSCPPCKRVRLKAIPDFLLPPPFFNLESESFSISFHDE